MTVVAFICGVLVLLPLLAVLVYVIIRGVGSLSLQALVELPPNAIVDSGGGFGNAIVGTIMMVAIASFISIPFGVLAAIYLTEFGSEKVARWVRFATNILNGVPSIIAGVFAYVVIVLTLSDLGLGSRSAIAGGVALSIVMLPIIVRTTDESLQLVSQDLRQAAVGLGATNFQTVIQVVLPAALPAIITGATLSIARAAGETAPLLFTAGFSGFWPDFDSLLKNPTPSIAVLVYTYATSNSSNWQSLAWAASLILVLMVLITSIIARWVTHQKN
jgi:phosphate transport system permease protein